VCVCVWVCCVCVKTCLISNSMDQISLCYQISSRAIFMKNISIAVIARYKLKHWTEHWYFLLDRQGRVDEEGEKLSSHRSTSVLKMQRRRIEKLVQECRFSEEQAINGVIAEMHSSALEIMRSTMHLLSFKLLVHSEWKLYQSDSKSVRCKGISLSCIRVVVPKYNNI